MVHFYAKKAKLTAQIMH